MELQAKATVTYLSGAKRFGQDWNIKLPVCSMSLAGIATHLEQPSRGGIII